jgi:GTP-binding protein
MFIDEVKIFARSGHGGRGCIAFLREAYRPKGGPSGGNGGSGGDVILVADHDLNNLINQYYVPNLRAEHGEHGMGKGMDGAAGKDLVIPVPCGTMVWKQAESGPPPGSAEDSEEEPKTPGAIRHRGDQRAVEVALDADDSAQPKVPFDKASATLVADLTTHGEQFVLCRGGRGGLGNRNFATSRRQSPRFAQPGEPGEEGHYLFEMRIMAEVGLVGYPNAGKSTLLTAISRARPKIASYPFTTLTPQVGIVEYADLARLTVCDVPGLIEGAHRNVGLGHAFLRHIQRCKVLILLLDMAGTDGRAPWDDYRQLLKELELYSPELLAKPRLVAANKMDEPAAAENLKKFKKRVPKTPLLPISAAFDQGLDLFKESIRKTVEKQTGR